MKSFLNSLFVGLRFSIRLLFGKKVYRATLPTFVFIQKEFVNYVYFLTIYIKEKLFFFSSKFERNKNVVVKNVLIRRGRRNRFFLHISAMAVLTAGVVLSPFITDNNPFSTEQNLLSFSQGVNEAQALAPQDVFQTQASEKPRSEILEYVVEKGDTLSGIAQKFSVSEDTIKWENNLRNETITVGDTLRILPVTGIAHKVASGDTIYTIAKKYDSNPQAIVDFPFNDFADPQTFSLVVGQILIVPDGVAPQAAPTITRQRYIATGPITVTDAGFTWPIRGTLNQYYAWYHQGIDIGAPLGAPIVAAQSGTVVAAYSGGWHGGYGVHVIIQGSNGYSTLYAHMSGLNVSAGDSVTAGSTVVGWIGLTGRTTGAHLHFEIRGSGGLYNPLSFLR